MHRYAPPPIYDELLGSSLIDYRHPKGLGLWHLQS